MNACQSGTSTCQTFYVSSGTQFNFVLKAGTYAVNGFYVAAPFDNAVDGPSRSVTLAAGNTRNINLSVTYRVPGSAVGTIRVTGSHPGVVITAYTVLACPTANPWTGGIAAPQCVNEFSGQGGFGYGPGDGSSTLGPASDTRPPAGFRGAATSAPYDSYLLSLTPGQWLLYPGYQTVFGSVVDHTATTVSIESHDVTKRDLTLSYQTPTQAAVTGTVDVIGAPANQFRIRSPGVHCRADRVRPVTGSRRHLRNRTAPTRSYLRPEPGGYGDSSRRSSGFPQRSRRPRPSW